jgi:4-hydroxybutyrate dehydrogenase
MALIRFVNPVYLEAGARLRLGEEARALGWRKPLIVTDAGVRAAGVLDRALEGLADWPLAIFDGTPGNPTEAAVRAAWQCWQDEGCDGLIAIGGGSSIDLAKGLAVMATHEGPLHHYATIEGGSARIGPQALPLIAVPTTAGTGSEVARGSLLITDDGRKLGFHSWHLLPRVALCDPELTLALPAGLTAATGMDALAHCLETFMSAAFNPVADGIALEGLRRGWGAIKRAVHQGDDLDARLQMMCASSMGAMAFQKGLGCVHSLSHAIGGLHPRAHHGTLNAVFLPAVLRFNAPHASMQSEGKLARLAQAMGVADAAPEALAEVLRQRTQDLALPTRLSEMGLDLADADLIIERAMKDHCHGTNPRVASAEDYERLLRECA